MSKQKQIGMIALGTAFFLLSVAPAYAATVAPGDTVTMDAAANNIGGIGAYLVTDSAQQWLSFCIEKNVTFEFNRSYRVDSVGAAVYGGVGVGDPGGSFVSGSSDPISHQTAYLYNAFLHDTLPGGPGWYDGSAARQKSLQIAFWYLENEIITGDTLLAYGDAQNLITFALGYGGNEYFGVKAFNPATYFQKDPGSPIEVVDVQSMLYQDFNSVPEPGTMLLLGSGLVGLVGYGRRRFKK